VHWAGDSMVASAGASGSCFDATIAAGDADGAALMTAAFTAWAAAAPVESATTVTAADNNTFVVHACDPGTTVSAGLTTRVPVAFGGAGVELALVNAAISAGSGVTVDASCLISAARSRGVELKAGQDDPPVVAVNWTPPYVSANLDLATGCVSAAPAAPADAAPAAP
jgi:hypothetical protein